jgi:type IV pilus assembly protein PilM
MLEFLNLKPETFGLDFSDTSLKLVKIEKVLGKQGIVSFSEVFLKPGVIKNGEIRDREGLAAEIRQLLSGVKGKKLNTDCPVASLPEEKGFLEVIQMPKVLEKDLGPAVVFEAQNHIPLPMEDVYFDFQTIPIGPGNQDHQDVLIAALPKKIVDGYVECLKMASLKPLVFEPESLAISRALIKDGFAPEPVLMIDFGMANTSFVIFSGHSVRLTFSLPLFPGKITENIARALGIDIPEARKLKKKYGLGDESGKTAEQVSGIIATSFSDFISQTKKHLDYYYTHVSHEHLSGKNKKIARVLIFGGGSGLKGLQRFLANELDLQVEFADPWVNISKDIETKPILEETDAIRYIAALGLALRGLETN